MPVPLIDLTRNQAQLAEIEAAIVRVVRSGHYILGPEVENLETELAQYLGCRHALTMSSGTDALLAPMMALGIGPGDQVVLPVYTYVTKRLVNPLLKGWEPNVMDFHPSR